MIVYNVQFSIVALCRQIIADIIAEGVATPELCDWENHANIENLPEADLLGPTAIGMVDDETDFEVNFAIGVSAYNDENLFRHRKMVAMVFERLRPLKKIAYYDVDSAIEEGYMIIKGGTMLAPMSRAVQRPWQFVQATALLEPTIHS